jgi:hypothetical protein
LRIQKNTNPDIESFFAEDITKTSLSDKQVDLSLMLDVLEHVPDPRRALKELKRISRYAIFTVPLGDAPMVKILKYVGANSSREATERDVGHVNFYNAKTLAQTLTKHCDIIVWTGFANIFEQYRGSELNYNDSAPDKAKIYIAECLCGLSPKFCSSVLGDEIIVLVKCY